MYLSQERRETEHIVINYIFMFYLDICLDRIRDVAICIVITCLFS